MSHTEVNESISEVTENASFSMDSILIPLGEFPSIEEFTENGLTEIIQATKAVNSYPQEASRDLYCAYPTFGRIVDRQSDQILGLISMVLQSHNIKGNIQRRQRDEQFEMLLECNDTILERLNTNLDDLAGIKANQETIVIESHLSTIQSAEGGISKGSGSWNLKRNESSPMSARLITAKNIARPQLKFKVPIDNSASTPFVPKLKDKPNSLKPLAILPEYDDDGNIACYLHPYEFELMKFDVPESQLQRKTPVKPADVNMTDLLYVDTVAKLHEVVDELRQHKEIAIDVEHHSYRTFLGFTCLVQVSTRIKDYLFDALALRDDLHILNIVFTDPKVVKIFHGADLDIEWLQRDLSLYIVNMFDTHQAAKALNFARFSLAYLLKHYCGIDADKTFQLADWRIRPLPAQLVDYARQDTHFLIYIYERISNDLLDAANLQTNLLRTIYQRSTELCKKRYVKPVVRDDTHLDFLRKSKRIFDNRQMYALCEIFKWRDAVARQEDESYGYVLPNHMLLQIAESLPREMQGILACCKPIPPLVRQQLHTLHHIVLRARQQPVVKPIIESVTKQHTDTINTAKDYNSKLYCPHDLSRREVFRNDLPTLLAASNVNQTETKFGDRTPTLKLCKPRLTVFESSEQSEDEDAQKQQSTARRIQPLTPYERYLATLPLAEKEKREETVRIEAVNRKRKLCPVAETMEMEEKIKIEKEDDVYNMPVKEYLKRKYEESVAKKSAIEPSQEKRLKTENTSTDDSLKFDDKPPAKKPKISAVTTTNSGSAKTTTSQKSVKSKQPNQAEVIVIDSNDDSDANPTEIPSTSKASNTAAVTTSQPLQKSKLLEKKQRKKNKFKLNRTKQGSEKPVQKNFDYASVDFNKFQGGAQYAKGTELKPKFHGKSNANKANNKKFNKLFTFSNVKAHK